jgi:hypothetical protein
MTGGAVQTISFPAGRSLREGFHVGVAAVLIFAGALPSQAQQPVDLPASTAVEAPAYVDRVIDPQTLPDEPLDLKASSYNSAGWPRSLHIDYSIFSQTGAFRSESRAIGLNGFLDTPNYGALSLNANLVEDRTRSEMQPGFASDNRNGRASTWRIDQRGLPLEGGWLANHSAGDINAVAPTLAHGLGRVTLPSASIRGMGGQWLRGSEVEINASAGRPGLFSGYDVPGFESTAGTLASAGAQFRLPSTGSGQTDAAVQVISGSRIGEIATFRDTSGNVFGTASGRTQDTDAFWGAVSWEGQAPWAESLAAGSQPTTERIGGLRVQGNMARSQSSIDGEALGLWLDAAWRTERWRNSAGVFRFDPNLRWGTQVLASDLKGVYIQADTSTRQWQAGYALELSDSVSGAGFGSGGTGRSVFANLNGRYRLDTANSVGAALNLRGITNPGQAVLLTWDRASDWGQTQWRSDVANTGGARTVRFGVDQGWPVSLPATFNTSLAWERVSGGQAPGTAWIWGLLGSVSPYSQWSLDGSLRGANRSDGATSVNANIGVGWQSQMGWSLALRYTEARGREPLSPLVVSALTEAMLPPIQSQPTNRSVQLLLRYEGRAGSSSIPIGGFAGSGSGSLSGTVFFDGDRNGRREASEGGVPNVTVILDRRFVTRTDSQGRYEFASVAPGEHTIEVSADNVPLPWSPAVQGAVRTRLVVRQISVQDFPVQRDR